MMICHASQDSNPIPEGPKFLKSLRLEIPETLYQEPWAHLVNLSSNVLTTISVNYSGTTSSGISIDVAFPEKFKSCEKIPWFIRARYAMVWVDPATRKPTALPESWKERYECSRSVTEETSPVMSPPKDARVILESTVLLPGDSMDHNGHVNVKSYIIKAFSCIKEAYTRGCFTLSRSSEFSRANIKVIYVTCYSETLFGDVLTFQMFSPVDISRKDTLYVYCLKGDKRCTLCQVQFYEDIIFSRDI